ncbi:MAG: LysM peptidoglycan-binding domain-containing protein [Bacteroidetes bacterium]|nr:LysM peptidoglycan-binding domain-containing protein [Bacteroidota bacterium]
MELHTPKGFLEGMKHYTYYFLLLFTLIGFTATAQVEQGKEKIDTTVVLYQKLQDNPVAAMLDSLANLQFFDKSNNLYDVNYNNIHNFAKDFVPFYSDDIYMDRISQLGKTSPIPLVYNRQVKDMIELYAVRKRGLTQRMLGLAQLYFPMMEELLDRYGIPLEMKYLAIVESALNPIARSPVGAGGLWQFMYGTGRQYDLDVNSYVDDRSDPYKSTIAACKHLKDLYKIHKDWLLVLASYNSGPGNVAKAIRRSGGKTDFWQISPYLPKETRGYVPAFIAVTYVMHHAADHNLFPIMPVYKYHEIDTVTVKDFLTFDVLSEKLNVSKEELLFLNPAYRKGVIPSTKDKSYFLRLPKRIVPDFVNNETALYAYNRQKLQQDKENIISQLNHSQESFLYYVKRKETVNTIAEKFGVSANDIRMWNNLRKKGVRTNQRLIINRDKIGPENNLTIGKPLQQVLDSQKSVAKVEMQSLTQAMKNKAAPIEDSKDAPILKYHFVKKNQTIAQIANIYGVNVSDIKSWNHLKRNSLAKGKMLRIYVEAKEPALAEEKSKKSKNIVPDEKVVTKVSSKNTKKAETQEFYVVKSGESLQKIANKYNVSIAQLIEWNNLNKKGTIIPKQKLIVSENSAPQKEEVAVVKEHASKKKEVAPKKETTYTVKGGDSYSTISRKVGLSVNELKGLNEKIGDNLKPGQKLTLVGEQPKAEPVKTKGKEKKVEPQKEQGKTKYITYTVQKGDNLWRIASKHKGSTVEDLKKLNNIGDEGVKPGQKIKIAVES